MTGMNHRKLLMGGRFDRVGNPKGYDVVASVMEKADVHFRIETLLKKVKSRWRQVDDSSGTLHDRLQGTRVPLHTMQIGQGVRKHLYVLGRSVKCCLAHISRILSSLAWARR
jgi:hypothetical protein